MYYPDFDTFIKCADQGNLIPVYREILADIDTPVSALMKLGSKSMSFFLRVLRAAKNGEDTPSWERTPALFFQ